MEFKQAIGRVFASVRKVAGLTQEDFEPTSPRTYISHLERGLSSPTLEKLDALSRVMNVHPASLVFQIYLNYDPKTSALDLMATIMEDLKKVERHTPSE